MSEEVKSLRRKRGSIKSRLTSFKNFLAIVQADFDANEDLTELSIEELGQRLKRLTSEVLSDYHACSQELVEIIDEQELDQIYTDLEDFEETYYKITAKAQILLNKVQQKLPIQSAMNTSQKLQDGHCSGLANNVKLPSLKLPEFDGSYDKWLLFYDTFKSVIHSNDTIADIQKFHYLSSSLTGDAAKVIQGLEISAANYNEAWKLLERRYKNKALMIHNHRKGVVEYPKLTKQCFSSMRNLLNAIQGHLRALEALEQSTENWSSLLMYIIVDKFDSKSRSDWEKEQKEDELPDVPTLIEYMEKQCQLLEKIDKPAKESTEQTSSRFHAKQIQTKKSVLTHSSTKSQSCPICKQPHMLYSCQSFLDMSTSSRIDEVKRHRRCLNCLREGHISINCKSTQQCRKCHKLHNTLLHIDHTDDSSRGTENTEQLQNNGVPSTSTVNTHVGQVSNMSHVLPTAVVQILDSNGNTHSCVALLDSGSQSNFLSTELSKKLKLRTYKTDINVVGVNQTESQISEMAKATIKSTCNNLNVNLEFYLTKRITSNLPNERINLNKLYIPDDITLADPQFHRPKNIDMLIGVDLFWDLLCPESAQYPYLHKTKLGYVVSGRIPNYGQPSRTITCGFSSTLSGISNQLKQFWEMEETPKQEIFSNEEKACEANYTLTTRRNDEGRFVVTVPIKGSLASLGDSEAQARQRFSALERKLQKNDKLRNEYVDFMNKYEELGHMSRIHEDQLPPHNFYLPHHGVLKEDSLTTKLRVVFDGSTPSTSGVSINDLHMVGPTIQKDLLSIILRFRLHPFVVGADISMMYRQVLIDPQQRPLQRILWRPAISEPIRTYELDTVTYGLASSSFSAIRCLFQLADESEKIYPKASKVIRECMYVDDLLYGANTIEESVQIAKEVRDILSSGRFPLRKWISNEASIIKQLDTNNSNLPCHTIQLGENEVTKTLGLSWSSVADTLVYDVSSKLKFDSCTKRSILSLIARVYDPLGLLSPCIIVAKILLQKLWLEKSTWDQPITSELQGEWKYFLISLSSMKKLQVARQVCCSSPQTVEIHAFSDASEVAYGACVYLRSIDSSGNTFVRLMCAKSKVAPLKSVTLPRLELCGAQIAVKLVNKVKNSLDIAIDKTSYWTDSTIVLSWLRLEPCTLKTFVSNRVSEIQSSSNEDEWHHVISEENPADMLSRGVDPAILQSSTLWWEGPAWLADMDFEYPDIRNTSTDLPEVKKKSTIAVSARAQPASELVTFTDHSNLNKLERMLAYTLRFISNCRSPRENRQVGSLTRSEIRTSSIVLVKMAQRQSFHEEINSLLKDGSINSKSKLFNLNPFLHTDGTLRVGGRLDYSTYNFDKRHPMLLSSKHHLTKLIFIREHKRLLHVGPQALLSCLREVYWPMSGRNLARKTVHDCVKCFRVEPRQSNPIMGNLPRDRITPAPPFHVTGVDYAGPFTIIDRKGRGCKTSKCYVALFVCLVTKAIHLELVSDLTADSLTMALRRFASCWGMPAKMWPDNGTNFVKANSDLKELGRFLLRDQDILNDKLMEERFDWTFIPAYSPHFGGIWEAGVKATKHHLKRVAGNARLTFEELYTLLAQIRAILNSRPLSPMSPDPNDPRPLTPAHLLVGRSLTSVPDPDVTHLPESHLSRFQRIQQIQQHFWSRWSKEYVAELQFLTKWRSKQSNIQIGQLVVVKEDNLPPMRWQLGRVTELHPGKDDIVRVVSIKTSKGIIRRSVARICSLPLEGSVSEAGRKNA